MRYTRIYILIIAIIIFATKNTIAQDSTKHFLKSFDISTNADFAAGKELKKVYNLGVGLGVGLNINILEDKLFIKPKIGYKCFGNYYNEAARDNLHIWTYGAEITYEFQINKEVKGYPVTSFGYNKLKDVISPRSGYTGDKIDLLSGNGLSFGIGMGIVSFEKIHFRIMYNYFKPVIKMDEEIINQANEVSSIYDPFFSIETPMNFSSIQLGIVYQINFR